MPFTPHNKTNLVSWLAVRNDGSHYGQYVSYLLPKDRVIYGPQQVASFINQDPTISRDFTLLHSTGSQVQQGNLLVVPIGNSFLYFEPVYLRATTATGIPELKKVILADQNKVVYADTLDQAIQQLVGLAPPPTTTPPTGTPTTLTAAQIAKVQDLITQANKHYKAAQDALKTRLQAKEDEVATELRRDPQISVGDISTAGGRLSFLVRDPDNVFWLTGTWGLRGKGWLLFYGRGWGHGVGMCQVGAFGMAHDGAIYGEILKKYYKGIEIKKLY